MPKKPTKNNLKKAVDRLGELKAEISNLQQEAEKLKTLLKESDLDQVDGKLFRAKVSMFSVSRVSYKDLVAALKPSKRMLNKFTSESEQVRLSITARNEE